LSPSKTRPNGVRIRVAAIWRRKWVRVAAVALTVPCVLLCGIATYYYVSFARLIDTQLHGERERVAPRIFARPLELRVGQSMSAQQLVDRLNDIGYAHRSAADQPGEFADVAEGVVIAPRSSEYRGQTIRVRFPKPPHRRRTPSVRRRRLRSGWRSWSSVTSVRSASSSTHRC